MDADGYVSILEQAFLPFLRYVSPDGHRFVQDNDPKHTSKRSVAFFCQNGVNWFKTPPESPDLNPIENLWLEMKEYLRREVKPHNKAELVAGIEQFGGSVTAEECRRYIRHLRKVIPRVIAEDGGASGY